MYLLPNGYSAREVSISGLILKFHFRFMAHATEYHFSQLIQNVRIISCRVSSSRFLLSEDIHAMKSRHFHIFLCLGNIAVYIHALADGIASFGRRTPLLFDVFFSTHALTDYVACIDLCSRLYAVLWFKNDLSSSARVT